MGEMEDSNTGSSTEKQQEIYLSQLPQAVISETVVTVIVTTVEDKIVVVIIRDS